MTANQLTEIRAAVAAYGAAHQRANEFFINIAKSGKKENDMDYLTGMGMIKPAVDNLHKLAPDYLRLLLPVVEAAMALTLHDFMADEWSECNACEGHAIYDDNFQLIGFEHKPDCRVGVFTDALKALK